MIGHGDGRIDAERLTRFILAYQSVAPLTLGELWAWPIMLKLGLLENLGSLTENIIRGRAARRAANAAVARLEAGGAFEALPRPLHSAFVAQVRQRMLEHDPRVLALHLQVEEALAAQGTRSEDVVRSESQRQAKDQASIGNTFSSLRPCATQPPPAPGRLEALPMTTWIERTLNPLRTLAGWNDISERRLTPAHGWLLSRARATTANTPAPAPGKPNGGSGRCA